ncbi:hypothetical protein DVH24_028281 [Malus domestica]|uniref:Uncharacterized protein n=1 Tax=Malus domestica TaxID=3750 RepID=A0A498HCX4_MALDO|nr:hypothetical protein DVH24_028281 [Malus domestica]
MKLRSFKICPNFRPKIPKSSVSSGSLAQLRRLGSVFTNWSFYVLRRPTDALVRRCDYETKVQGRRGRGRPRKTLDEAIRKDLEYLDLTKDMTQN